MRRVDPRRLGAIGGALGLAWRLAAAVGLLAVALSAAPAEVVVTRDDLVSVFGENGAASAAVLAGYEEAGLGGAMAAYREYRRTSAPARLYYMWPGGRGSARAADRLMSEGAAIGSHPAFSIKPPVPWDANPYRDRSWRYGLNSLSWLMPVLEAYQLTGEQRYLDFALAVVLDWHRQNVREGLANPFAWYDMAVGLRGPVIAFLVDAAARRVAGGAEPGLASRAPVSRWGTAPASEAVSDEDLWLLLETALRHGQELRDPAKYAGDYNHGLYQMLGLLALSQNLPELRNFPEYREYAEATAERVLLSSFSRDGVHLEHSPGYQLVLLRTLEVALNQGLVDTPKLRERHRLAQEALAWLTHPTGHIAGFGDTVLLVPSSRYLSLDCPSRCAALLWVLTRGEQGAPPEAVSWVAREGGYAVFRSAWTPPAEWESASYLVLHAGRHSRVHKHADDLTFEWTELGQPLIVDSGRFRYWYDDPRRQYVVSTRAHNTVEIDERDYAIPRNTAPVPSSAIRRWSESGAVRVLEAEITHFDAVQHRRTLLFSPAEWLLVLDELSSPNEHQYTQWFHFHPDLELEQRGDGFVTTIGDTGRVLHVRRLATHETQAPIMVKGQEEPRLQGWTALTEGSEFVPNWALGFRDAGSEATFVTLFTLERGQLASDTATFAAQVETERIYVSWVQNDTAVALTVQRGEPDLRVSLSESPRGPTPRAQARPRITVTKHRPVFMIGGELRATARFTLPQEPEPDTHFFLFLSDRTRFRGVDHLLFSAPLASLGLQRPTAVQHLAARVPENMEAGTYYLQGAITAGEALHQDAVLALWSTKVVLVEPEFDHPALAPVLAPQYLTTEGTPDLGSLRRRVAERAALFAEEADLYALPPIGNPLEIARRFL